MLETCDARIWCLLIYGMLSLWFDTYYDMPTLKHDYIKMITKYDYVTSWGMLTNSKNKNKTK